MKRKWCAGCSEEGHEQSKCEKVRKLEESLRAFAEKHPEETEFVLRVRAHMEDLFDERRKAGAR
jgi:hypothetical protein